MNALGWRLRRACRLAAEYGLHPVYKKEFHEVFEEHQGHAEFGPLLERMKVVDKDGESQMDEDQWEAASACLFSSLVASLLFPCLLFPSLPEFVVHAAFIRPITPFVLRVVPSFRSVFFSPFVHSPDSWSCPYPFIRPIISVRSSCCSFLSFSSLFTFR